MVSISQHIRKLPVLFISHGHRRASCKCVSMFSDRPEIRKGTYRGKYLRSDRPCIPSSVYLIIVHINNLIFFCIANSNFIFVVVSFPHLHGGGHERDVGGVGRQGRERDEVPAGCCDRGEHHAQRSSPGKLGTRAHGKGATTAVDKVEAMFDEAEDKGSTKVNEARETEKWDSVQ